MKEINILALTLSYYYINYAKKEEYEMFTKSREKFEELERILKGFAEICIYQSIPEKHIVDRFKRGHYPDDYKGRFDGAPQLIITDRIFWEKTIPEDRYSVLLEIRKSFPETPIIVFESCSESIAKDMISFGADKVISPSSEHGELTAEDFLSVKRYERPHKYILEFNKPFCWIAISFISTVLGFIVSHLVHIFGM